MAKNGPEAEKKWKTPSKIHVSAMFAPVKPGCFAFDFPFIPISGSEAFFNSIQT